MELESIDEIIQMVRAMKDLGVAAFRHTDGMLEVRFEAAVGVQTFGDVPSMSEIDLDELSEEDRLALEERLRRQKEHDTFRSSG